VLDTILGFSIRALVLEKPEDVEAFRRKLRLVREELERQEAAEKEGDGKKK
jgi:hypothetical protein